MAAEQRSFYVTLPSNSSMKIFPTNTLTSYITHLPDVMDLNGDYDVGLSEIHYPNNWTTFYSDKTWQILVMSALTFNETTGKPRKHDGKLKSYVITFQSQSFVDIKHLIDICNKLITEKLYGVTLKYPIIQWDSHAHCVVIQNTIDETAEGQRMYFISLSPPIAEALGFQDYNFGDMINTKLHTIGSQTVSQRNLFDQIYVYSDICEERYIGDVKASLLRVVPIKGKPGDVISIIYEKPQYIPVVKNRIQTIQILLRTDTGDPIKFINGRVVVTLHFRRRRLDF